MRFFHYTSTCFDRKKKEKANHWGENVKRIKYSVVYHVSCSIIKCLFDTPSKQVSKQQHLLSLVFFHDFIFLNSFERALFSAYEIKVGNVLNFMQVVSFHAMSTHTRFIRQSNAPDAQVECFQLSIIQKKHVLFFSPS